MNFIDTIFSNPISIFMLLIIAYFVLLIAIRHSMQQKLKQMKLEQERQELKRAKEQEFKKAQEQETPQNYTANIQQTLQQSHSDPITVTWTQWEPKILKCEYCETLNPPSPRCFECGAKLKMTNT